MSNERKQTTILFIDYSNIQKTAMDMGFPVSFEKILENLRREYSPLTCYVYLRNGYQKCAEFFANIGFDVVLCLANADFLMGYDIHELVAMLRPSTVIIASHDGGVRQVADKIERMGVTVKFLVFRTSEALSTFLEAKDTLDIVQISTPNQPL